MATVANDTSDVIFASFGLKEELEREIIGYLGHTGALACTCKGARSVCRTTHPNDVCCPTQQFHHPQSAELVHKDDQVSSNDDDDMSVVERHVLWTPANDDDSDDEEDWMGLSAWKFREKVVERDMVWSCCGGSFHNTGCISNNGVEEEEAMAAIAGNEEAKTEAYDSNAPSSSNDGRMTPDWDDSIYGDAKRWCTCGYADGVYTYCCC